MLENFCQRVLDEAAAVIRTKAGSAHERYRRVHTSIEERDEDLARAFDDYRRSTAVMQLAIMRRMGLLGDEDLKPFSEETQQTVRGVDGL